MFEVCVYGNTGVWFLQGGDTPDDLHDEFCGVEAIVDFGVGGQEVGGQKGEEDGLGSLGNGDRRRHSRSDDLLVFHDESRKGCRAALADFKQAHFGSVSAEAEHTCLDHGPDYRW